MNHLVPGIIATGVVTAILGGLTMYGFSKKKLPHRDGSFILQADQPVRFKIWLSLFTAGAFFSAVALLSLVLQLFG